MTVDRTPTVGDAKARAAVRFPGQVPGTTMHGRLVAVGGRKRDKGRAVILLPSGRHVTRPVGLVRLLEEPRVVPG